MIQSRPVDHMYVDFFLFDPIWSGPVHCLKKKRLTNDPKMIEFFFRT